MAPKVASDSLAAGKGEKGSDHQLKIQVLKYGLINPIQFPIIIYYYYLILPNTTLTKNTTIYLSSDLSFLSFPSFLDAPT